MLCLHAVCEWLLFNAKLTIFSYNVARTSYICMMMVVSALYLSNNLSCTFIVLARWNNSLRIDMSLHTDTLSWFWANQSSGADPGGGGRTRRAPLKIGKNMIFFGVKSWFFTRNTPKIFAPPSAIEKNMIFWRKIMIFHTKYPKHFLASLRSAQFF